MRYEVIWDVDDEVFGGVYSLHRYFENYEDACKFAADLRHDDLVSNVEIYSMDGY